LLRDGIIVRDKASPAQPATTHDVRGPLSAVALLMQHRKK
jgi:hypothetical protein